MSALPKQVQQQIDAANKAIDGLKQQKAGTPPGEPPAGDPPGSPPANNAPAPSSPPPQPNAPQGEDSFERKYRVLQGKYNAEVPNLQRQVNELLSTTRELQSQLVAQQGLMSTLAQRGGAAPVPTPQPAAATRLVKDDEIKTFGEDLIDVMRRVAREETLPEFEKLRPVAQRVNQVERQVSNVVTKVASNDEQQVLTLLAKEVPNWEEQNRNPEFIGWLQQRDPYAGVTRQALLEQAYSAFDAPRVIALFKGFQNEHAAVNAPARSTPPAAPAAPPAGTPNRLEEFVAPGTQKNGDGGAPNEAGKRIWTQSDITAFNQRRNSFITRNRPLPDDMKVLERDLMRASAEGRVRV